MKKGDLVIGLDCGTSSAKALAVDPEGRTRGTGKSPIALQNPAPLRYEQDADEWWRASALAIREAAAAAGRDRIRAISISHQRETFVPVATKGKLISRAILWSDGRAGGILNEIKEKINEDEFRAITGKALSGNLTLCKILWLMKHESRIESSAQAYLDVHAFLSLKLTGKAITGWGSADPTGMFDMRAHAWSAPILDAIGLELGKLPETVAPGTLIGTLSSEAAEACGLSTDVALVAGLGDGQAAGLGCGIIGPGESYLSLGTSIVTGTFSRSFIADKAFRTSFGGVPGSFFLETVILAGAQSLSWFMDTFGGGGSEKAIADEAASLAPGAGGLVFLPYLNAAMNPYWDADASGLIAGLSRGHGRAHAYRAVLEGIAQELRLHTEGLEEAMAAQLGVKNSIERYVAVGGGSAHSIWNGIIADVTGRRIARARAEEAGALGAGILAAGGSGTHADVETAARMMAGRESGELAPNQVNHGIYGRYYDEVYAGLYSELRDVLKRLSAFAAISAPRHTRG